jgi:hypothetical protein
MKLPTNATLADRQADVLRVILIRAGSATMPVFSIALSLYGAFDGENHVAGLRRFDRLIDKRLMPIVRKLERRGFVGLRFRESGSMLGPAAGSRDVRGRVWITERGRCIIVLHDALRGFDSQPLRSDPRPWSSGMPLQPLLPKTRADLIESCLRQLGIELPPTE